MTRCRNLYLLPDGTVRQGKWKSTREEADEARDRAKGVVTRIAVITDVPRHPIKLMDIEL